MKSIFTLIISFLFINSSTGQNSDSLKLFDNLHWKNSFGNLGDDSIVLIPRNDIDTTGWYKLNNNELYYKLLKPFREFDSTKINNISKEQLYLIYLRLSGDYYGTHIYRINNKIVYERNLSCAVGEMQYQIKDFILKNNHIYISFIKGIYYTKNYTEFNIVYDIDLWTENRIILTICK